jgi:hypoxanthine phosphoribosyltransferase
MTAGTVAVPGRRLYGETEIASAVDRLAHQIARDHAGQPVLLLGVLKGALYFTVDLARALAEISGGPSTIEVEYLCAASYGMSGTGRGEVALLLDTSVPLEGRHVVIVEDIADNGLSLTFLQALVRERGPASLRTCVLLDKPSRRRAAVPLEYVGLVVPDTFVVGYGLDYQERYRNLPYLAEIENRESQPVPT